MRLFTVTCAVLFLSSNLYAEEKCSTEVKLLLSPRTVQAVITSLKFEKETTGRVYFFDTQGLDLLKQGAIVRVRQGGTNDLTIKVRVPESNEQVDATQLPEHFPCEINRTGAGVDTDYSVQRKYKALQALEMGNDIADSLSPAQKQLLEEAHVSIDWSQIERVANVKTTKWETTAQSPFRKLTLELWEWPAGSVLEISAKAAPDGGYPELQRLVVTKRLVLSANQANKTSVVLEKGLTQHNPR